VERLAVSDGVTLRGGRARRPAASFTTGSGPRPRSRAMTLPSQRSSLERVWIYLFLGPRPLELPAVLDHVPRHAVGPRLPLAPVGKDERREDPFLLRPRELPHQASFDARERDPTPRSDLQDFEDEEARVRLWSDRLVTCPQLKWAVETV